MRLKEGNGGDTQASPTVPRLSDEHQTDHLARFIGRFRTISRLLLRAVTWQEPTLTEGSNDRLDRQSENSRPMMTLKACLKELALQGEALIFSSGGYH